MEVIITVFIVFFLSHLLMKFGGQGGKDIGVWVISICLGLGVLIGTIILFFLVLAKVKG